VSSGRNFLALAFFATILATPVPVRADGEPDPSSALLSGAAVEVAGLIVGGAVVSSAHGHAAIDNAGWLSMQSAFVLAPIVAHGVSGEWARGSVLALAPAVAAGGAAVLFAKVPQTVESGTLPEQRWMWAFFTGGLLTSAFGVLDVCWAAPHRSVTVSPTLGLGGAGLRIEGFL
jgi:hypothetical protein